MKPETRKSVLVADDDIDLCKTLAAVLSSEGYRTTIATSARDALELTRRQFFDIALLDIRLPDMEGTHLLQKMQKIAPSTIKIVVTGYPSLESAVKSLDLGASAYVLKPVKPEELLRTIKEKLGRFQQEEELTRQKLAKWVQHQACKLPSSSFENFQEEMALELERFGLTKNQAKIYITTVALGIASAHEVAKLSGIRREEIYRMMPELEKHGLIARRLERPRRISAAQPEEAISVLARSRITALKTEIVELRRKETALISKLKKIVLPLNDEVQSIEVLYQSDNVFVPKFKSALRQARKGTDMVVTFQDLQDGIRDSRRIIERALKSLKIRIITELGEPDASLAKLKSAKKEGNHAELRAVKRLPFRLIIVDEQEAVWGGSQFENQPSPIFRTTNRTQIGILKMSFKELWREAQVL